MNSAAAGRLAALLAGLAAGVFPAADGTVTVLPQPSSRDAGVLALTAHTVIFADVDPAWVRQRLPADDLSAPLNPPFLAELSRLTGRRVNNIDMLCFAPALPGPGPPAHALPGPGPPAHALPGPGLPAHALPGPGLPAPALPGLALLGQARARLAPVPARDHPRAARARRYRDGVRAWETDGGLVILGRGVAGRWEIAVEVAPGRRGQGLGRELALAGRHLVPAGEPLWAQIAPGNSASVRAFLAAGYVPVGAEALLVRA